MRQSNYTLSAAAVTPWLSTLLVQRLRLPDFHDSVPGSLLARLLLLASALGASLSGLCKKLASAPTGTTVLSALGEALPADLQELQKRLQAGLHALVPPALRGRRLAMAADLHLRPFYGDKKTPGLYTGPRQQGTTRFFAYATLAVLEQGRRFTVGLVPVETGRPLEEVLAGLLAQARACGLRPAYLLLDRGFYDADVFLALQRARVPFVVPMIRRGKQEKPGQEATGTQPLFSRRRRTGWYDYAWTARPRHRDPATGKAKKGPAVAVAVSVCVVQRRGRRKGPWVFACWGLRWPPVLVARRYRRRFGIETSYRQLGQCLAQTTSTDRRVRLLLVGVALVLRNAWAWLHWEVLAGRRRGFRRLRLALLTLADLLLWLVSHLARELGLRLEVRTERPVPFAQPTPAATG
jgi:putative transposase